MDPTAATIKGYRCSFIPEKRRLFAQFSARSYGPNCSCPMDDALLKLRPKPYQLKGCQ